MICKPLWPQTRMSTLKCRVTEKPLEIPFEHKTITAILTQKAFDDNDQIHTGGVILTHGAGGDMNTLQLLQVAHHLAEKGFACARFTCKALNLKYRIRAYKSVLDYFSKHEKWTSFIIGGRSMGARAAVSVANESESGRGKQAIKGVICLSYPLHPPNDVSKLRNNILQDAKLPVLFLSGTADVQCKQALMEDTLHTMSQAQMHWLEGADHGLNVKGQSNSLTNIEICQVVSDWCETIMYLPDKEILPMEHAGDTANIVPIASSGNV